MKLTFLGAAGTVTGSKFMLESAGKKILIDCGLFQGLKSLRLLNWQSPQFTPSSVQAILLTHGHLDHVGYLPRLVKLGFRGKIYATAPTLKIAELILKDSAKTQEEESDRANIEGYSKHKPALPLYDLKDVAQTLKLFCPVQEGQPLKVEDTFAATFLYNGHIVGSTFIQIEVEGKTLVFSGDIGRKHDFLLYPPKKPIKADVLLIESTYGGTLHKPEDTILLDVEQIVTETINRGGSVFIPTFAVERTQLLMFILWRLFKDKRIPAVPMIMDSPMGANVLEVFRSFPEWHKLSLEECTKMCTQFQIIENHNDTKRLRKDKNPKIVLAGSGMVTGGRILDYLEVHSNREKDTLLFVGFQAVGTRGRQLLDGAKQIKIYGKILPFSMQVKKIDGLSGHGDQGDLLNWVTDIKDKPANIFIIHAEPPQAEAFKQKLLDDKDCQSIIPTLNQSVEL